MGETHTVLATVRDASVRRRAEIADEQERALLAALHEITSGFLAGDDSITRSARSRVTRAHCSARTLHS